MVLNGPNRSRDLGMRESRKEPPAQLSTPVPGGGWRALSSRIISRICVRTLSRSASDSVFQAFATDCPWIRFMTIKAWFLWTKEQYTQGTGMDVLAATNFIVTASVRWTNGLVLTTMFLEMGTHGPS